MTTVLELRDVSVRTGDGRTILTNVDWVLRAGQRWAIVGPNGGGKSTLLQVAGLYLHPSTGSVTVLGEQLGRTDVRTLRARIGVSSAALAAQVRPSLSAADVVMTARFGALEPWWHTYCDEDRDRARALLDRVGCTGHADQTFGTLSSGERQRTLIARALMNDPAILLLDEPTAGLDLSGREELVSTLASLADDPRTPPVALVTHHVEDIPPGFTHAMVLGRGSIVAQGGLVETLSAEHLSDVFGLTVNLLRRGDRYSAYADPPSSAP